MSISPINNLNACDPSSQASMNAGAAGVAAQGVPNYFSDLLDRMMQPQSSSISGIGGITAPSAISGTNTNDPLSASSDISNNNVINPSAAVAAATAAAPLDPTVSSTQNHQVSGIQSVA